MGSGGHLRCPVVIIEALYAKEKPLARIKASFIYFLLVYLANFAFGTLREFFVTPYIGLTQALLIEVPINGSNFIFCSAVCFRSCARCQKCQRSLPCRLHSIHPVDGRRRGNDAHTGRYFYLDLMGRCYAARHDCQDNGAHPVRNDAIIREKKTGAT